MNQVVTGPHYSALITHNICLNAMARTRWPRLNEKMDELSPILGNGLRHSPSHVQIESVRLATNSEVESVSGKSRQKKDILQ